MLRFTTPMALIAVLAATTGCGTFPIVAGARLVIDAEGKTAPRIIAPVPTRRLPLSSVDARALPPGARAWLPAYDGDPVAVVLTPTRRTGLIAEDVRADVIVPIFRALGLVPDASTWPVRAAAGIALPAPRLALLAPAVAHTYAASPPLLRPGTRAIVDVLLDPRKVDDDVDRAVRLATGMTFAQLTTAIERREIVFPFSQTHGGVPIEHTGLVASAWDGESVRSVQGAVLAHYQVANAVTLDPASSIPAARQALAALPGVKLTSNVQPSRGPALVLLPFGTDSTGSAVLRYAYRMEVEIAWRGRPESVLLWADAAKGTLLALEPRVKAAGAAGRTFNRDPGVAGTLLVAFEVDDVVDGQYVLALKDVSIRLDYRGDGYHPPGEVSIDAASNGSTASFANFAQSPIEDASGAVCASPTPDGEAANRYFQQVNVFATVMRHRQTILGGGIFEPYPPRAWAPTVEYSPWGCNADSVLQFGLCPGYRDPKCPHARDQLLNFAHDNTMIAHELGHSATSGLVEGRPWDWCAPGTSETCPLPRGWGLFHDLADFWGAHLESTNCIGGWVGRNVGGVGAGAGCGAHSERDWFPRKLEVTAGATTGDHFPEHRDSHVGGVNDYADGQIAGAALWEVRSGVRSMSPPTGIIDFGVRYQRALVHTGFDSSFPIAATDLGMYQRLLELLLKMTEQWATSGTADGPLGAGGAPTTSKVTAGFARAGIFLVPWPCLDADRGNTTPVGCSATNGGADAVIDVDDNDPGDDLVVNDVTLVDRDYLRVSGGAPTFHVWTGPRYRFHRARGATTMRSPAPCNDKFSVEVSVDPTFATITATSPWTIVNHGPAGVAPTCYGTWTPTDAEWQALRAGGAPSKIYYRARTRDVTGGTERLSTQPGNGLWTVPPPFAVITTDGRPQY